MFRVLLLISAIALLLLAACTQVVITPTPSPEPLPTLFSNFPPVSRDEAIATASSNIPAEVLARSKERLILLQPQLGIHGLWQVQFQVNVTRTELGWQDDSVTHLDPGDSYYEFIIVRIDMTTGDVVERVATKRPLMVTSDEALATASSNIPAEVLARSKEPLVFLQPQLGTHGLWQVQFLFRPSVTRTELGWQEDSVTHLEGDSYESIIIQIDMATGDVVERLASNRLLTGGPVQPKQTF